MSTNAFDVSLIEATAAKRRQNKLIAEQQRVQSQNTVGTRLLDAINNAGNIKPDRKNPDTGAVEHNPEYDNAQTAKQQLMDQYNALMSPEQHANFGDRLHGLIFGQPTPHAQQPALSPNSSPITPPPDQNAPQVAAAPAAPAPPPHPMAPLPADHPMHAITNGIQALGNHLKAFAQPLPPPVKPDTALMAKYYRDPAEVAHERTMEMWGQRGMTAEDIARIRAQYQLTNTPEKARLDSGAKALGFDNFPSAPPDVQDSLLKQYKVATTAPAWKPIEENGKIYAVDAHDPSKPKTLIGNKDQLTETRYSVVEPQADGTLITIPMVRYTTKGGQQVANLPLASAAAAPAPAASPAPSAPVSANAPAPPVGTAASTTPPPVNPLAAVNAGITAGNAASPKLNKGKPGVGGGRVVGYRPTPLDRADVAQYQKVAEDANSKEEAYTAAQKAISQPGGPTPSSDQELIYAWVRANVQGAGRMTQAEFLQAQRIGSLPQKAENWWELTLKGTLDPDIRKMMLNDIKRAYDTSKAEAIKLRPKSSNAPSVPTAPAAAGKPPGW